MPLRDHFRPPLFTRRAWTGFHGQWPAMIVLALSRKLPPQYVAEPNVHPGSLEIDIGIYEEYDRTPAVLDFGNGDGGVATAVWAPPRPTLSLTTDLPDLDEYEVRIYDTENGRQLVAAIEIVSPANKDRPEHRRAFATKCAALLQQRVSVAIIDLVTNSHINLYRDLLDLIGEAGAAPEPAPIYAAACRGTKKGKRWRIETWEHTLAVGQPLPTLPLWLADDFAVPLELEQCYEETCRALRIA